MIKYTLPPMRPELVVCPNSECDATGRIGVHSHKERRYICHGCKTTFADTTGSMLYGLKHPNCRRLEERATNANQPSARETTPEPSRAGHYRHAVRVAQTHRDDRAAGLRLCVDRHGTPGLQLRPSVRYGARMSRDWDRANDPHSQGR